MKRTVVNPSDWGIPFSLDQGHVIEGATRHLKASGQVSVVPDPDGENGIKIIAPNDMRGQMEQVFKNIDALLETAGMSRENIIHLHIFTTDIGATLEQWEVYQTWIGEADIRPPQSLIGVAALFNPEVVIEIEIEAAV